MQRTKNGIFNCWAILEHFYFNYPKIPKKDLILLLLQIKLGVPESAEFYA
jgi:hypothetical protein